MVMSLVIKNKLIIIFLWARKKGKSYFFDDVYISNHKSKGIMEHNIEDIMVCYLQHKLSSKQAIFCPFLHQVDRLYEVVSFRLALYTTNSSPELP